MINNGKKNRLDALHAYDVRKTESEEEFDNITKLAAGICDAPVAKINFVDGDTQWTKSLFSATDDERSIPRDQSICQHTIEQDSLLEVPDLTEDPRFKDLPSVKKEPHYKYYLGAQLKTEDGHSIGALCVLDYEKRELDKEKRRKLKILANQVMTSLELRRKNQRLTQLNEQKNRLMKILSHDLRSPLSGIIGMSDLLMELVEGNNDEAQEMVSHLNQSAKQLNQLIDDILNHTIIESEGFSLNLKKTDVHRIVENMRKLYMPSAKLKKIDLSFDVDVSDEVCIDSEKFEQILGNLLSNALKFTENDGKVVGKVKEIKKDDDTFLVLQVIDTGIGMEKKTVDNLFQNQQSELQKGTSGEKSTGLGLSIIKHFTNLHNGSIDVDSKDGEGTTFTIHLPIQTDPE